MSRRQTRIAALVLLALAGVAGCTASSPEASSSEASSSAPATPPTTAEEAAPCTQRSLAFDPNALDLTGAWAGDDGGIYYLRQVDSVVWWNGMSGRAGPPSDLGRQWNNVARGEIQPDLTITVDWADVPRGDILGNGTLVLQIEDDGSGNVQLSTTSQTGDFGNRLWTPCSPG